jgi:hypothetical protein
MNIIDNTLAKHGLTKDTIPKKTSNKIDYLEETKEQLNMTKAELEIETDDEVKAEMNDTIEKATAFVDDLSQNIVAEIEAFVESKNPPAEQNPPAPIQAPKPNEPAGNEAPKKKGAGAMPWIIGGVLLVLTLGAVNVMQEK